MATVLITGGTGLIGTALTKELIARGDEVIIVTRAMGSRISEKNVSYAVWDPAKEFIDMHAIMKADYIVHLAGANVAEGRWTKKRKKELVESRVLSGQLLVKAINNIPNKVRAVISASAIGYYGEDPSVPNKNPFVEQDTPAQNFLGNLAREWEQAIQGVLQAGKRLVIFRTGIVLSKEGGAYPEFIKTLPLGTASILGNGKQVVSWIHIKDLVNMYLASITNEIWNGVYNAVAPVPVSNKDLILQVAKQRGKFYVPVHVPNFILKAMVGEMSVEILKSTTVSAEKIIKNNFKFLYPTIDVAAKELAEG